MIALSDGQSGRLLAFGIPILALLALYYLLVLPLEDVYATVADGLQERAQLAARYEALAEQLPKLKEADRQWRGHSGGELLLAGGSDALAQANLQTMLKQVVEDAGTKLTSAEFLPVRPEENFRRIGIRMAFSGDLKMLTAVLRGIETARPCLFAGDFDVHTGGPVDDEGTDSETLSVSLDVFGFRAG